MKSFGPFVPWVVLGLAVVYLIAMMAPPAESGDKMRVQEFAALPLLDGGRVKPFDTLARNSLMIVSGKQTFVDANGKEQPAVRWLLDVMTSGMVFKRANRENGARYPIAGEKHKVFRIDNPEVLSLLGLKPRERFRYAINEFSDHFTKLEDEEEKISRKDAKKLTPYEKQVHDLYRHLQLYMKLANWNLSLYTVPPLSPGEDWQRFDELGQDVKDNLAAKELATMLGAYVQDNSKVFNDELEAYQKQLGQPLATQVQMSGVETFFNHFEPFYQCAILYLFVFLLACCSWLGWREPLRRSAFWLAALTLVVHSLALLTRMYLQGRPPVTNLYSSAVFIGWGCVGLGLVLEYLFPISVGNAVAGLCGGATMLIANYLGSSGDTLEMLQAVLDTNFWLATHVTCVTMGYTATFVAGILGIIYLFAGVATPGLNRTVAKVLSQMLYGVVCFAMLLSFTGTVLGGIWADQSWGRFWGWDPKENGALLIVIWNALILHARWGGMVQQRGMAVLAVVGNMVTGWSWFGTNQLGVGLHAYGFNDTLATGLVIFWISQFLVIGMGLLPLRFWASYAALTAPIVRPTETASPPEVPHGKRRGKRGAKRGDAGYFPGPA
ncbi:MAG TPA: cytochrome c biogenesis protein CcsA [Gemmataceae bacterium]|jgi:ABC-type transport system involved in cytochrome c biogenesis permease subunit